MKKGEEIFNSITHGVGVILSIIGFFVLLIKHITGVLLVGYVVFGISLLFLYLMSTLYHSLSFTKARSVFQILDQSAIFLLIAGTYTPFALIILKNLYGTLLIISIWIIAAIGIIFVSVFRNNRKIIPILCLVLGWIGVTLINAIFPVIHLYGVLLVIFGGLFYSFGTIFYAWKKIPFNHGIWHILVILGSTCHYLAIYGISK